MTPTNRSPQGPPSSTNQANVSEFLSPDEIASHLRNAGYIGASTAERLKGDITAYGDARAYNAKISARQTAIYDAIKRAQAVLHRIKSVTQRAAAEQVLRAIERLLPQGREALKEAYAKGWQDRGDHERHRCRQHKADDARHRNERAPRE
jgi:hypothetical protein